MALLGIIFYRTYNDRGKKRNIINFHMACSKQKYMPPLVIIFFKYVFYSKCYFL